MNMTQLKIDDLKIQAKRLRQAMADRGTAMPHSAALELVARQHGARDWNTLAAQAERGTEASQPPFAVGNRLSGRYLGQPFEGRLVSLTAMPAKGLYKVVIHFDRAVDVVTFESFSALRQRVTAVVDEKGVSPRKTSNGRPHLVVDL